MKKPELLAPAGSFEKAKTAFMYGADAVYCGTGSLSLRSRAEVDDDDLAKTIEYAHSIGKKVYAAITSPSRPIENVTQWCKQAACWERVKQISCDPVSNLETLLQGHEEVAMVKREARQERKLDNEIDNMKFVFELGEAYWKQMELWLRSHRIATAAESKALIYATKISSGFFPDERQSKNLMKLREKAIAEGFPPK